MKRILLTLFIISLISFPVRAEEFDIASLDTQINSLYAANKLDETYKIITNLRPEERTANQWTLLGNVMMDYDKPDEAIYMYKEAIGIDDRYYKAYYNLANVYLNNEQPNLAIDNYKLALKYNKEFAPAYYNLGCAYLKINELKKAKNAFHDAVYFKPTEADYFYNLAYTYKALGNEKSAKLYLDYYNKIINSR